jgi:hypothetical protein
MHVEQQKTQFFAHVSQVPMLRPVTSLEYDRAFNEVLTVIDKWTAECQTVDEAKVKGRACGAAMPPTPQSEISKRFNIPKTFEWILIVTVRHIPGDQLRKYDSLEVKRSKMLIAFASGALETLRTS